MVISVDAAVRVLVAGGGLRVKSSDYSIDSLVRMAVASGGNNPAQLYIVVDGPMSTDGLVRIGVAGQGRVVFDNVL